MADSSPNGLRFDELGIECRSGNLKDAGPRAIVRTLRSAAAFEENRRARKMRSLEATLEEVNRREWKRKSWILHPAGLEAKPFHGSNVSGTPATLRPSISNKKNQKNGCVQNASNSIRDL